MIPLNTQQNNAGENPPVFHSSKNSPLNGFFTAQDATSKGSKTAKRRLLMGSKSSLQHSSGRGETPRRVVKVSLSVCVCVCGRCFFWQTKRCFSLVSLVWLGWFSVYFLFSVVISSKFWWEKSKHSSHVTFICLKMLDVQAAEKNCLKKRPWIWTMFFELSIIIKQMLKDCCEHFGFSSTLRWCFFTTFVANKLSEQTCWQVSEEVSKSFKVIS